MWVLVSSANAEIIKPAENLSAYDVIKIQLDALKNNDDKDNGIKQTWLFAHPDNKKMTGPYPRFRIMLYDVHYRILLNHFSHKIDLIMNTENKFVYGVKVLSDEKQQFFYEWHVKKAMKKIVIIVGLQQQFQCRLIKEIQFEKTTFCNTIFNYRCYISFAANT